MTPTPEVHTGCALGFWKHNKDFPFWSGTDLNGNPVTPSTLVKDVFARAGSAPYTALGNDTLLQALSFHGGRTLEDAAQLLLKQAVAAFLNAESPSLTFNLTPAQVQSEVNAALNSQDRDTILNLQAQFDALNGRKTASPIC